MSTAEAPDLRNTVLFSRLRHSIHGYQGSAEVFPTARNSTAATRLPFGCRWLRKRRHLKAPGSRPPQNPVLTTALCSHSADRAQSTASAARLGRPRWREDNFPTVQFPLRPRQRPVEPLDRFAKGQRPAELASLGRYEQHWPRTTRCASQRLVHPGWLKSPNSRLASHAKQTSSCGPCERHRAAPGLEPVTLPTAVDATPAA